MSAHNMTGNEALSIIWAEKALTGQGWANRVSVAVNQHGVIVRVDEDSAPQGVQVGALLPAPANLHSHAFQRAMAGLTERPGPRGENKSPSAPGRDNFWTWRNLMYRFLDHLTPDDIFAISAFTYMQMLEAGFSAVGEFHYLHHQPDGQHYDNIAETSTQIAAAAAQTGIGLTLLPVLYQQAGCDGRPLAQSQLRFGNTVDQFARIVEGAEQAVATLGGDCRVGVAAHSLRAVNQDSLQSAANLRPGSPVHIHIAEQTAEVDEVIAATGQRPVQWLLNNATIDEHWCLVHATHMTPQETTALAATGAVAGLCPITEANLGDGIFDGERFASAGGTWGIGSDANIRISIIEELRLLEYSQRLGLRARAVLAQHPVSNGRFLWERATRGGGRALARGSGAIAPGQPADLVALDSRSVTLEGHADDTLLDSAIFAGTDDLVTDTWAAGRHLVQHGHHIYHGRISNQYRTTMKRLRSLI